MLSKSPNSINVSSWRPLDCLPQAGAQAQTSQLIRCLAPLLRTAKLQTSDYFNPCAQCARLDISFSVGTITLCMDVQLDPALAAVLNEEDAGQRCALAQLLLVHPLSALNAIGFGPATLAHIETWQGPLPTPKHPVFQLLGENSPYPFLLANAQATILELGANRAGQSQWQSSWLSHLKLAAFPCLANQRYQTERLGSLRPGDVLLAPIVKQDDRYTVSLHCGDLNGQYWYAQGQLNARNFSIEQKGFMTIESITNAPATSLSQLDVPVQLELEPIVLPIAQLEDLAPGHVLELASDVQSATIRLMVYGQEIGHGKLVAIGDHLGVQISGVAGSQHGND